MPAADAATPPADVPYQVPAKAKRKRGSKADPVPPPAADPNPLLLTEPEPTVPPVAPEQGQEGVDVPAPVSSTGSGVALAPCMVCLGMDTVASMQRTATGGYICGDCVLKVVTEPSQEAGSTPRPVPTPAPDQKPPATGQETGPATTPAMSRKPSVTGSVPPSARSLSDELRIVATQLRVQAAVLESLAETETNKPRTICPAELQGFFDEVVKMTLKKLGN